jgi:hypothetical protein
MVLFSLPFFMEICNGDLLQLVECIELMKNDVKRKMRFRMHSTHVLKSPDANFKTKIRSSRAHHDSLVLPLPFS